MRTAMESIDDLDRVEATPRRSAPVVRAVAARRGQRGLSVLELAVSTTILSALVMAASTASQTALTATADVVALDASGGSTRHTLDRLELLLVSASLGTLEGVPAAQGVTPEPLQEGVDYRDLRFRRVIGFSGGAPAFEPPLTAAAVVIQQAADGRGSGALQLVAGGRTATLQESVRSVTFRRDGSRLRVTLEFGSAAAATSSSTLDVVLRVQ